MAPEPLSLPVDDWKGWLEDRARGQLRHAGDAIAALKDATPEDEAILQVWNDAWIALDNAAAACSLLSVVHPDPAVIGLAEQIELEVQAFRTDLFLDADVFALLGSVDGQPLDVGAQRMLDEALRDFRRAGVDRDERDPRAGPHARPAADRPRRRRSPATSATAGVRRWCPPPRSTGCPRTSSPGTRRTRTGWSRSPRSTRTCSRSSRSRATPRPAARSRTASSTSPGRRTTPSSRELLATRHEKATLLGYASWPDYDAEVKMIGTGDAIGEFVDRISRRGGRGRPSRDRNRCSSARATEGEDTIDLANWRYYHEAVKREQYGVDAQEVRRYFDFGKVHAGPARRHRRLFGLDYDAGRQAEARTWHPDVTTYDVGLGIRRHRRAARPDPPRPAPARAQVQPRGAVRPGAGRARPAAARGGAGLQLPARADGPPATWSRSSTSSAT